ncbi:MAG: glycoside hydrolase family 127 protein [Clostridia bacterium]|nr:glycoside hydrolase family 127 protein [Clostridia bacterium]
MIDRKFRILAHAARFRGAMDAGVRFTTEKQLLDAQAWSAFVRVYTCDSDDEDEGWRGEFWGKMMRGACLTYQYSGDEALCGVLTDAVEGLLKTQREDGRISTYSAEKQLRGWDVWSRKYVITGFLHYYRVCKDEDLKKRILDAVKRHADALIDAVGDGEGQIRITDTSEWWGGVNSSSILEPYVDLYTLCGEKKYLDFAEYIISCGGCRDGNLIDLAEKGEKMPFEYPEQKAYETISFFEGLLAYYETTGKEYYFNVVKKFIEAVADTDITVIGCSGCTHELFDHSALAQTERREGIMQETCVTVTWMRMLLRLYLLTGEAKYYTRLERSARNALYGSINTHNQKGRNGNGRILDPLPFDSYSPLTLGRRGKGIGGLKHFSFGGFYGCCACIAAAGVALLPLSAVTECENGFVFSTYESGKIRAGGAAFAVETDYPVSPNVKIAVSPDGEKELALRLRVPENTFDAAVFVNGEKAEIAAEDGFFTVRRIWSNGDTLELRGCFKPVFERLNGLTAVLYGPTVLARDEAKEPDGADISEPAALTGEYTLLPPEDGETLRVAFDRADGKAPLPLTDYASCGKLWENGTLTSVWNSVK